MLLPGLELSDNLSSLKNMLSVRLELSVTTLFRRGFELSNNFTWEKMLSVGLEISDSFFRSIIMV